MCLDICLPAGSLVPSSRKPCVAHRYGRPGNARPSVRPVSLSLESPQGGIRARSPPGSPPGRRAMKLAGLSIGPRSRENRLQHRLLADCQASSALAVDSRARTILRSSAGAARGRSHPGRFQRQADRAHARPRVAWPPKRLCDARLPRARHERPPPAGRCRGTSRCQSRGSLDRRNGAQGVNRSGRTVVDRAEGHAVIVDGEQGVAQREDLEAAGIREDRAVPAGERVQTHELRQSVRHRPECRWYVFPRITSAPSARTSSGCSDFTVPFVPTA